MTRTLLLAEAPFRDLRSRAILLGLPRRLGIDRRAGDPPLLVATTAPRAPQGFEPMDPAADPAALGIGRVVLAGVFANRAALEQALALAARAVAAGARLEAWGLTLERAAARRDPPQGIALLDGAAVLEARDHHTANTLLVWRVAAPIRIGFYAERQVAADPALLADLPPGPCLGLALLGAPDMRATWWSRLPELAPMLAPMRGWPILPLPADVAVGEADDHAGSLAFAAEALPDSPVLLPALADPLERRRLLTAGRMRALLGRCHAVITNQDLVAAMAAEAGVPVAGLVLGRDRRIVACMTTLANHMVPGSLLVFPPHRA
jgi:hypothetical protein